MFVLPRGYSHKFKRRLMCCLECSGSLPGTSATIKRLRSSGITALR